jgi:hypothetical protein
MEENRSIREFINLVRATRAAQEAYWKTPSYAPEKKRLLVRAKELEKQVDEWIAAQKQPELGI